jgi:hypothetical protein
MGGAVARQRSETAISNLDSILDDALDDFEEQEMQSKIADMAAIADIQGGGFEDDRDDAKRAEMEKMQNIMNQMNDPTFGRTLQTTLQSLSSTSEGAGSVDNLFAELAKAYDTNLHSSVLPVDPNDPSAIETADRQVAGTLQMLSTAQGGMAGFEASKMEAAGETMMEDMMAQFEALGEKEDYNEVSAGIHSSFLLLTTHT